MRLFTIYNSPRDVFISQHGIISLGGLLTRQEVILSNARGLDLSRYNGKGNWEETKASGVSFVIVKAGGVYSNTGVCYTDNLLADHVAGAKSVGIPFGLYWYFLPFTPVSKQINYYRDLLIQYKPDIPYIFVDVENNNGQSSTLVTSTLKTFVSAFSKVVIYTRASWFNPNVKVGDWKKYDLWAARYATGLTGPWSDNNWKFRDWDTWRIWQMTGENNNLARQYGFPGSPPPNYTGNPYNYGDPDMDTNQFNGDENSFRQWAGLAHVPTLEDRLIDLERRITNLEAKCS